MWLGRAGGRSGNFARFPFSPTGLRPDQREGAGMPCFCFSSWERFWFWFWFWGSQERSLRGVRGVDRCAGASGFTPQPAIEGRLPTGGTGGRRWTDCSYAYIY